MTRPKPSTPPPAGDTPPPPAPRKRPARQNVPAVPANEIVYDAQVKPLLDEIRAICGAYAIPFLFAFQLQPYQGSDKVTAGAARGYIPAGYEVAPRFAAFAEGLSPDAYAQWQNKGEGEANG